MIYKEWTVTNDQSAQKRIAIYLRVSTGEQTTDNQQRELEEVATHGIFSHCAADRSRG
jgi:DNA invertase Pin-like site-specific DNA recombinase